MAKAPPEKLDLTDFDFTKKPAAVGPKRQIKFSEKTIEWLFAKHYFQEQIVLAPLAGNEEAAGDAMLTFSHSDKWLLLEFKRDIHSFIDEEKKYAFFNLGNWQTFTDASKKPLIDAFEKLKKDASAKHPSHYFVYGEVVETNSILELVKGKIKLFTGSIKSRAHSGYIAVKACNYWCHWPVNKSDKAYARMGKVDLMKLRSAGSPLAEFKDYVRLLLVAKGQPIRDDGDGWGYGTVMAITEDGLMVSFSLLEFAREANLLGQLTAELSKTQSVNGKRGPRM